MNNSSIIDFNIKQNSFKFHPLASMLTYLKIGFLFGCFELNIGWLPYMTSTISILLIFLGLRMVKDNHEFQFAFYLSLVKCLLNIISLILLVTPYIKYIQYWNIFLLVITYILMFCLYKGLHQNVQDQHLTHQFLILYIILQAIGWSFYFLSFIEWLFIILYLCIFIGMYRTLTHIQHDLLEYQYDIKLSLIKIETYKIVIGYMMICAIAISSTFFIGPFTYYNETTVTNRFDYSDYQDIQEDVIEVNDLKLQYTYCIYEFEDFDMHVLDYEWLDLPFYTYMQQMIYQPSQFNGFEHSHLKTYCVYDDERAYQSHVESQILTSWMGQSYHQYVYTTYVDPLSKNNKGQILFIFDKENRSRMLEHSITLGIKNALSLPYAENTNQGVELIIRIYQRRIDNVYKQQSRFLSD